MELEYPDFTLINLYLPHGDRQKRNLAYKLEAYKRLFRKLEDFKDKNILLTGDFNIAHQKIDLARPAQNQDNIMFTPEEREQIDILIGMGFKDSFREFNKKSGNYTWWPYAYQARERNLGWRIDYIFASRGFSSKLEKAFILSKVKGSDHCPIGVEIK